MRKLLVFTLSLAILVLSAQEIFWTPPAPGFVLVTAWVGPNVVVPCETEGVVCVERSPEWNYETVVFATQEQVEQYVQTNELQASIVGVWRLDETNRVELSNVD